MSRSRLDSPQIRRINRDEVFSYIKKNPGATITKILSALELSRPTVTNILEELEAAGLIVKEKNLANTGGRSAMAYTCDPNARFAVGIQLSQKHIRGVLVDMNGNVLEKAKHRILFHVNEEYRKEIGDVYSELLQKKNIDDTLIAGVGITVQALTDAEGTKVTYIPIETTGDTTYEGLYKYIPVQSRLFHDLYALGYNQNLWADQNVFYLSMNSSIGGTVLVDNRIYYGNAGKAGEIGHIQLERNGKECYCGNRGCFDAYCNTGVLREFAGGTLESFFEHLQKEEKEYVRFWDEYMDYFAAAIFSIRVIFDSVIMIGGELGKYAEYFLDDLRDRVDRRTFFPGERAAEYLYVYQEGEYAIAVGAAMYYIQHVLDEI